MKHYIYVSDADEGIQLNHAVTPDPVADALRRLLGRPGRQQFDQVRQREGAAAALAWFADQDDADEMYAGHMDSFHWEEIELPDPHIVLSVEGGVVHEVISTVPLNYTLLDHDTEGLNPERLVAIPQTDGTTETCYLGGGDATVAPDRVASILAAATATP